MRRGAWIVWLGLAAACGDDGGGWKDKPLLAARAETARQLSFEAKVPSETLTQEEFNARVEADVSGRTDEDLREMADTYGRLGFFDVHLDLRPILTASRIDSTGAFYSVSDKSITLIGNPEPDTLVHEYVHALQDQAFDLGGYDLPTSDGFLARRAVVEGDATLAAGRYSIEESSNGRVGLEGVDFPRWLDSWAGFSKTFLDDSDYPIIFRAYAAFAYPFGLRYSVDNLLGLQNGRGAVPPRPHDWTRQNAVFTTRAPTRTEQILGATDAAYEVGLDEVPASLSARLAKDDWDTLGAWYSYLLVRPVAPDPTAIRDHWDGDRALFAHDKSSGAAGVLWVSVWDDEATAAAVEAALHALHDQAGEPVIVERRVVKVVLARNFAPDVAASLVETAFTGASKPAGSAAAPRRRPPLGARDGEIPCLR